MKKIRILLLTIVMLFVFTSQIFATNAPQLLTNELDYASRYIFSMKDTSGIPCKVYIVPLNESTFNNWVWANKSDKVVKGEYVVFLAKTSNIATAQKSYLFGAFGKNLLEGIFNLTKNSFQNRAFVVSNPSSKGPDILFVAQQVTGSGDASIRAFYIDSNILKIIHWKNGDGQLLNNYFSDGNHPIYFNDTGDIMIPGWVRSTKYRGGILSSWKFSYEQQAFIFKEQHNIKYE